MVGEGGKKGEILELLDAFGVNGEIGRYGPHGGIFQPSCGYPRVFCHRNGYGVNQTLRLEDHVEFGDHRRASITAPFSNSTAPVSGRRQLKLEGPDRRIRSSLPPNFGPCSGAEYPWKAGAPPLSTGIPPPSAIDWKTFHVFHSGLSQEPRRSAHLYLMLET